MRNKWESIRQLLHDFAAGIAIAPFIGLWLGDHPSVAVEALLVAQAALYSLPIS